MLRKLVPFLLVLAGCSAEPDAQPAISERPPARPESAAATGETRWFVVDHVFLGTKTRDGVADPRAWAQFGYDLDGRTTTTEDSKQDAASCKRPVGAPASALGDGSNGIDNNAGQHVIPTLQLLMTTLEDETNARIAGGRYTMVLRLENVGPSDNAHVPGALWLVGERGPVEFSPDERWPVAARDALPLQLFPEGYMRGGVWVSTDATNARAAVPVPVLGDPLVLPLERAVLSVRVADGRDGVIAGAVPAAEFARVTSPALTRRGMCRDGATHAQVMSLIARSADLPVDDGVVDPARDCGALSIGVGFTMRPIGGLDAPKGPPKPPLSECSES